MDEKCPTCGLPSDLACGLPTCGLPSDLARVLTDRTIIIGRDYEVTMPDGRSLAEHMREWRDAPSNTAPGPHKPGVA